MKAKIFFAAALLAALSAPGISAQDGKDNFSPAGEATAKQTSAPVQSKQASEVSRERRAQAYAKLLEGQRYIWLLSPNQRRSSEAALASYSKLAKQALQKSAELDPTLAEAYTALAGLAKDTPPYDYNEAIMLAGIAVKIDPDSFGAHHILALLYTFRSGLTQKSFDLNFAQKAIDEWNQIARLDPRNAEAFAFLSEFYARTDKKTERIAALRGWLSSSMPISRGFYERVYQGESSAPQAATLKLGQALLQDKQMREAVEILSRAVSEEPNNVEAIGLLRFAVESADNDSVKIAVQALQQAAYANPDNHFLSLLLARVQSRTGKTEDAVKILRDADAKFAVKDKVASADLQVALADIYGESNRVDEAAAIYQNALTTRGIVVKNNVLMEDERNFAVQVFEKIINLYKKANRLNDAKATIERAKLLLGK